MNKLLALVGLFRQGRVVANPEAWKRGQITVGAVSALIVSIVAVASAFGYTLNLTHDQIEAAAGILIAINGLFHPVATVVSSEKVGVLPNSDTKPKSPLTGH